jgi:uncharacterized protein
MGSMASQWLDVLSSDECRERLSQSQLGRVGVTVNALPVILPVVYHVFEDSIFFFTEPGTKLHAAAIDAVVAFEVDHLDEDGGWSVLVIGRCEEVSDDRFIENLRSLGLTAGAPGVRTHLVRVMLNHISGREFTREDLMAGTPGYL